MINSGYVQSDNPSTTGATGEDEKVKVSAQDSTPQFLAQKLDQAATRPTVKLTTQDSNGIQSLLLSSEAYIDNVLVVSSFGNDTTAQRGQLNQHYSSLTAAVNAAQTGDVILCFGNLIISSQVSIVNGRSIKIHQFSGVWSSAITSISGVFNIQNNSSLTITGEVNLNFTGGLIATVINNSSFEISQFNTITSLQGTVSNSNCTVKIKNGNSLTITKVGQGSCAFTSQNGGITQIENIATVSSSANILLCGAFSGEILYKNIELTDCQNQNIYATADGTNNRLKLKDCTFINTNATTNAIIKFEQSGELTIQKTNISGVGRIVETIGSLTITDSNITTSTANEPISYTQLNASNNEITNTKTISTGAAANLIFQPDVNLNNSAPLLIDGLRTNASIPNATNLIKGSIFIDSMIK